MIDDTDTQATSAFSDLSRGLSDASRNAAGLGKSLTQAFDSLVVKGRSVTNTFNGLALSLSQSVLKAAFEPLQKSVGTSLLALVSGGASPFAFARGAALQGGTPVPFASGGVVSSPVSFPLAGGRTGLAGERGAEAILPLARGHDGRLGVASNGAAAAPAITINITTSDAESFQRSETQVAALLARAVALGQRNL